MYSFKTYPMGSKYHSQFDAYWDMGIQSHMIHTGHHSFKTNLNKLFNIWKFVLFFFLF